MITQYASGNPADSSTTVTGKCPKPNTLSVDNTGKMVTQEENQLVVQHVAAPVLPTSSPTGYPPATGPVNPENTQAPPSQAVGGPSTDPDLGPSTSQAVGGLSIDPDLGRSTSQPSSLTERPRGSAVASSSPPAADNFAIRKNFIHLCRAGVRQNGATTSKLRRLVKRGFLKKWRRH